VIRRSADLSPNQFSDVRFCSLRDAAFDGIIFKTTEQTEKMAFGRTKRQTPEQILQEQIAEMRKRLADLDSRLEDAEAGARSNHDRARELTIAGAGSDAAALDDAEQAITVFERRVATLTTAIFETKANLSSLEAEFAALELAKTQQAAAARLEGEAAALEQCISDFSRAMTALRDAAAAASANAQFEIGRLRDYASTSLEEIPSTIEAAAALLRGQARQVLNGELRPRLPTEPSRPAPVVPVPTRRVFALAAIKWGEDENERVARNQWADMPPTYANRAVALGFACETTDPKWKGLYVGFGGAPAARYCTDIRSRDLTPYRSPIGGDRHLVAAGFAETRGPNPASWVERGR
jgi:prefoldin subunit 5